MPFPGDLPIPGIESMSPTLQGDSLPSEPPGKPKSNHSSVSSVSQSCLTLCDPMNHSMPGLPVYHQLPEFTQIHVHQVSDAIQPSHPLSYLLLLPPILPSIKVFSSESTLHMRWPKYWSLYIYFKENIQSLANGKIKPFVCSLFKMSPWGSSVCEML